MQELSLDMKKRLGGMVAGAVLAVGCGAESPTSAPANQENSRSVDAEVAKVRDLLPPGYVETPNGQFHESCVHEVPEGGEVDKNGAVWLNGQLVSAPPPCAFEVLHLNHANNVASKDYGDVARESRALYSSMAGHAMCKLLRTTWASFRCASTVWKPR